MKPERRIAEIVHTGGRWVPPRKVVLPDLYNPDDEYLVRYVVFRTPWFGVQLHRINRQDNDRHLHNHPRVFWSLIVRGGYEEEVIDGGRGYRPSYRRRWGVGSVHKTRLDAWHSIRKLLRYPTWTLLIVGPSRQEWGFLTEGGFVHADSYKGYLETTA